MGSTGSGRNQLALRRVGEGEVAWSNLIHACLSETHQDPYNKCLGLALRFYL